MPLEYGVEDVFEFPGFGAAELAEAEVVDGSTGGCGIGCSRVRRGRIFHMGGELRQELSHVGGDGVDRLLQSGAVCGRQADPPLAIQLPAQQGVDLEHARGLHADPVEFRGHGHEALLGDGCGCHGHR